MLFTFSIPRKYKENGIFVFEKTQQLEEIDDILETKVSHQKNIKRRRERFGIESNSILGLDVEAKPRIELDSIPNLSLCLLMFFRCETFISRISSISSNCAVFLKNKNYVIQYAISTKKTGFLFLKRPSNQKKQMISLRLKFHIGKTSKAKGKIWN